MGFLDWFERDRKLTDYAPGDLRREEERLLIRENQALARLERLEEERESIFRRGTLACTSVRRRILGRLFAERQRECEAIEDELSRLTKETLTVSGIRFRIERRLEGDSSALKKVEGTALDGLTEGFEDASVSEEDFAGEVRRILGKVRGGKRDPLKGIGRRAREVIAVWAQYDRGEISGLDDGLNAVREGRKAASEEE